MFFGEHMIERYKTKEIETIWSEQSKINRWTMIEVAVVTEMYNRGEISDEDFNSINCTEPPSINRVIEIEKETDHDVVAFIRAYSEKIGPAARFVHKGLTSSDIVDTATSIAICDSIDVVRKALAEFGNSLKEKAIKYKYLPCIGRTHGMHAEPTSFGLKFLGWYAEYLRNDDRLIDQRVNMERGKLSGAVGNYTQHDQGFEHNVLSKLGLFPEDVATQVIPRDRHAELVSTIALIGTTIERMATEIRSLQRTEIGEVEEKFKDGQTGSSAMPHKHNPILSERLCGIARILRSYVTIAYENVSLWHERDISHSSNERIMFPDMFHLLHYMLIKAKDLIDNLTVFENKIVKNIDKSDGLIYSQSVLSFLIENGIERAEAYRIVQRAAHDCIKCSEDFDEAIVYEASKIYPEKITSEFKDKILDLFDPQLYLKNVDKIYISMGILE